MTYPFQYLLDRQDIAETLYRRATQLGVSDRTQAVGGALPLPSNCTLEVTNILCNFPTRDTAAVESYFVAWPHAPERKGEAIGGRCLDVFERRATGWAIAKTDVVYDWSDWGLRSAPPSI